MPAIVKRLLPLVGLLYLIGGLEGIEVARQRRRLNRAASGLASAETDRDPGPASAPTDRDPASYRLLALTWWPAGHAAIAAALIVPQLNVGQAWRQRCLFGGIGLSLLGVALRQWAIATLGRFFVGHVLVQSDQHVITDGPYRWLRHPSYTGIWLEMVGVGASTGNILGALVCLIVPLVGIVARIEGEEHELGASLPGYGDFARQRARLVPGVW